MKHSLQDKSLNQKLYYDKKTDVLWLSVKPGVEEEHKEISPGVSVELGKNGELLGIEILNASKVLGNKLGMKRAHKSEQSIAIPHKIN